MSLTNLIDPAEAQRVLSAWMQRRATDVEITNVSVPSASGLSSDAVLFDATWTQDGRTHRERLVARVAPTGEGTLFPSYDLEAEALIMRGLADHTDVPAPRIVFQEMDSGVLGGPFVVMERIDGRVPADDPPYSTSGWVLDDLNDDERRRMIEDAVDTIARLANVDWRALGLAALPRVGVPAQIDYFQHLYDVSHRGRTHEIPETGLAFLREHLPGAEPLALSWGDARLGNMLFNGDGTVAGALDWEVAHIGSPEADIAYFLFSLELWSAGFGAPSPPGFLTRDEVIARFERQSGHRLRHLHYYEVFGAVFAAVMVMRGGYLMMDKGMLPPDSNMPLNNPASTLLAGLLGLAAPTGASEDWAGKR